MLKAEVIVWDNAGMRSKNRGVKMKWLTSLLTTMFVGLMAIAPANTAPAPVRIGFAIAKTGFLATSAKTQINAYELWKDTVNARGGLDVKGVKRPIEFVAYDDQSDANKARQIYEKLIVSDDVDLLLAPYGSPAHIAIVGALEQHQFSVVGNTASSVMLRKLKPGYMWFTSSVMPDLFAQALVDFLVSQNVKTVSLIAIQLPYALEAKNFILSDLEKAGIAVKVNENYPPQTKDMVSLAIRIKESNVDAVLALSFSADSGIFIRQARESAVNSRIQMALFGPTEPWFLSEFGPAANGIISAASWAPNQKAWPGAQEFYDAYNKKFGEPPDYINAVLAYMSCQVLEEAVAKVGLDKKSLRDAIATDTFQTINGPVKFDGVENVKTPSGLVQIQDGKPQLIWPKSIATGSYIPKPAWPKN